MASRRNNNLIIIRIMILLVLILSLVGTVVASRNAYEIRNSKYNANQIRYGDILATVGANLLMNLGLVAADWVTSEATAFICGENVNVRGPAGFWNNLEAGVGGGLSMETVQDIDKFILSQGANSVSMQGRVRQNPVGEEHLYDYSVIVKIMPITESTWKVWLQNSCHKPGDTGGYPEYPIIDGTVTISSSLEQLNFYYGQFFQQLGPDLCGSNPCRYDQVCVEAIPEAFFPEQCIPLTVEFREGSEQPCPV